MKDSGDGLVEELRRARELYESRVNVGMALTAPHREAAKNATDAAVKFAENSFKSASLLNGGGLVAITPVMTLVGATASTDGRTILYIACAYCGGLLAALGGNVSGFHAMARRAEAADLAQEGVACFLAIETAPTKDDRGAWKARQVAYETAAARKLVLYDRWRTCGLYALALALAAFIDASAVGAFWFWNKLAPNSSTVPLYGLSFPPKWMERAGATPETVP